MNLPMRRIKFTRNLSDGSIKFVAPKGNKIHEDKRAQNIDSAEILCENDDIREKSSSSLGSYCDSGGEEIHVMERNTDGPPSLPDPVEKKEWEDIMDDVMEAMGRHNEQVENINLTDTTKLIESIKDARQAIERWKVLTGPWIGTERYEAIKRADASLDKTLQALNAEEEMLRNNARVVEEVVPTDQNENKTTFPSIAAQEQIAELNDLLARQTENLATLTAPGEPTHVTKTESISYQLRLAQATNDTLKKMRATHVRIKNCLAHDLPKQPVETVCLVYWKKISEIDCELRKIDDKIAKILSLIFTLQNSCSKTPSVPEIKISQGEPVIHQKRTRSLSPCMPKFAVAVGRGNRIKSTLHPPLPVIEEEDVLGMADTIGSKNKPVAAVEESEHVLVHAVTVVDGERNGAGEEFVYCDSESATELEGPQDVLAKITNLCDTLLKEQESCAEIINSETKETSQTVDLVETLEDLQAELRFYRDLLIEDPSHAPAMCSILKGIRKDVERLLNLSYKMECNGIFPENGGKVIPNLQGQWYMMGDLMDQLSVLVKLQTASAGADPDVIR